jgi:predicted MFS family arabinose efflux permease
MTSALRFPWRNYLVILVVIVLFAAAPLISVYFTYLVADSHGCTVNEATIHPCIVLGADLGGLLYVTGVMGWFMLATIPLGGGALIVWLVILLIHYLAWRQKARSP